MKKPRQRFSGVEWGLIGVMTALVGLMAIYAFKPTTPHAAATSTDVYKIVGTEGYTCTLSLPAQCAGLIKVIDSENDSQLLQVDPKTNFNATDPALLSKAAQAPIRAHIQVTNGHAESVKVL